MANHAAAENTAVSFAEIDALLRQPLDATPRQYDPAEWQGMGQLKNLAEWLATAQGRQQPDLRHPRLALFAASHGVDQDKHWQGLMRAMIDGGSRLQKLIASVDADLRLYDLDSEHPSQDIRQQAAMREEECARAIAYGMMVVENGFHLLAIGAINTNSLPARFLLAQLLEQPPEHWLSADEAASFQHPTEKLPPLELLCRFGGYDIAAMLGAIIASRLARTPLVLDGWPALAAAAIAAQYGAGHIQHLALANDNGDPLLKRVRLKLPLLTLQHHDLHSPDGVAAALAIPLLKAAAAIA